MGGVHCTPQQVSQRCRIVLAAAREHPDKLIAEDFDLDFKTVALWWKRFVREDPTACEKWLRGGDARRLKLSVVNQAEEGLRLVQTQRHGRDTVCGACDIGDLNPVHRRIEVGGAIQIHERGPRRP